MVTNQEKIRNKQYVLDHFEEYVLDSHGNFANFSPDIEGNEWFLCFGKDSFTPEGYEELKTKMFEMILREIKDWELIFGTSYNGEVDTGRIEYFRHIPSKKRISKHAFDFERRYRIIGELGYRENIWVNYEQVKKEERDKEWEKYCRENNIAPSPSEQIDEISSNLNSQSQQQETEKLREKESKKYEEAKNQAEAEHSLSENNQILEKKENRDNPSPSNQAKAEIDSNPNLTTSEQKEQANQLLKLIIMAELLVKAKKFNPDTLSQLVQDKKNNPTLYQLLNKESRVDKVIQQLESIQQSQKYNKNKSEKNNNDNQPPVSLSTKILLGIVIIGTALGIIIISLQIIKRKKLKR